MSRDVIDKLQANLRDHSTDRAIEFEGRWVTWGDVARYGDVVASWGGALGDEWRDGQEMDLEPELERLMVYIGAEILFALLHRLGWPALIVVRALLGAGVAAFVFKACRARGAATKPAAWITIASFAVWLPGAILRPQLLGLALFALTVWLVSDRDRHPTLI